MTVMALTPSELTRQLGTEVPDIFVVIAKCEVQELGPSTIAELVGVTKEEVESLQATNEIYQQVRLLIKAEYTRGLVDRDLGWDSIEDIALARLGERVAVERDADFLLKVAAVANRATRRQKAAMNTLDPSRVGMRVPLTLTARTVKRLNSDGSTEVTEERHMSITDGRSVNPSFGDVDALLTVSPRPYMDQKMAIQTRTVEPSVEAMIDEFIEDSGGHY